MKAVLFIFTICIDYYLIIKGDGGDAGDVPAAVSDDAVCASVVVQDDAVCASVAVSDDADDASVVPLSQTNYMKALP